MSKVTVQVPEPLLRRLEEIATTKELTVSEIVVEMLYEHIENPNYLDSPVHPVATLQLQTRFNIDYFESHNFSENLTRALVLICGFNSGKVQINSLSILWGILSIPYCKAFKLLNSKHQVAELLPDLQSKLRHTSKQASASKPANGWVLRTWEQFVSTETASWYPSEENSVFHRACFLAGGNEMMDTKIMLRAILEEPNCLGCCFLQERSIKSSNFEW